MSSKRAPAIISKLGSIMDLRMCSFGSLGQERITRYNQLMQINMLHSMKPSPVFFKSTRLIQSCYVGCVCVLHHQIFHYILDHFGMIFCRESPTTKDLSEQCQGFQGQARRNCTNQLCMPPRIISYNVVSLISFRMIKGSTCHCTANILLMDKILHHQG